MRYAFENCVLNGDTQELFVDGSVVPVEPKAFRVLCYLVENSERVISKTELVERVWDGRFISDAAISSAISTMRKALGDDGQNQRLIKTVHGRGFRFIGSVDAKKAPAQSSPEAIPEQEIRFCTSKDGTQLAFGVAGEGPPLVKTSHWLTHLEYDWLSPIWTHVNRHLLEGRKLIRYDQRGVGLSAWDVKDFSFERQLEDLEAVTEAIGLERFPLIGISQAAAVSAAFAARYPERVSKLILLGGYSKGWNHSTHASVAAASVPMIEHGWGGKTLAVQNFFSSNFMPDAPAEYLKWFSELQQKSSTGASAAALMRALGDVDATGFLGEVKTPTLVLHARKDAVVPFSDGRDLAARIPGARFVTLETKNHIMPESDPAWARCAQLISDFLREAD